MNILDNECDCATPPPHVQFVQYLASPTYVLVVRRTAPRSKNDIYSVNLNANFFPLASLLARAMAIPTERQGIQEGPTLALTKPINFTPTC